MRDAAQANGAQAAHRVRPEAALVERAASHAFLLRLSDALRAEADEEAIGALCTRRLAEHLGVERY